jgi:hypothetical protein
MLGAEIYYANQRDLPAAMRTTIRQAMDTCHVHARSGIELPSAFFTAGRLSLLLNQSLDAFAYYARGVRHFLDGTSCVAADTLARERDWLRRLHFGDQPPGASQWVAGLLTLAERLSAGPSPSGTTTQRAPRVLVVAGGAASLDAATLARVRPLLEVALEAFSGQVISGGTVVGVPGCAGRVAAKLAGRDRKHFELVGYTPERLPQDARKDARYDRLVTCGHAEFTPEQLLRSWSDTLDAGVRPENVLVLGFGGGRICATEYRLALAFGATVAVVNGTGGAAGALLQDDLWSALANLLPVPNDPASVRALVAPAQREFDGDVLDEMAQAFHEHYVSMSSGRLPGNMQPWPDLADTFKQANRDQARYAVQILEACGFGVRLLAKSPVVFCFTDIDKNAVEEMAELEVYRK